MGESPTATASKGPRKRFFSADAIAAAKARIIAQGLEFKEWADQHSFPPVMVYRILNGEHACRRGQAHEIAVALGLKAGSHPIQTLEEGRL